MSHLPSFASLLLCAAPTIALAACEHRTPAAASPSAPIAMANRRPVRSPPIDDVRDAHGCAMDVPGTRASVVVLDSGVALDLVTPGDVMELRRRVRALGEFDVSDLDHGVRVTIDAVDADGRRALASRAVATADALNRGDCRALASGSLR